MVYVSEFCLAKLRHSSALRRDCRRFAAREYASSLYLRGLRAKFPLGKFGSGVGPNKMLLGFEF